MQPCGLIWPLWRPVAEEIARTGATPRGTVIGVDHEAIAFAGRLGLERLVCVAVDNGSATHGWPGGIGEALLAPAAARHPARVVNVGIREQLMVSVAGGFALAGFRPIIHSYAPFAVERPYEQLKLDLGHQDVGAIVVSIGASYDGAANGRTHQAPEDVAIIGALPGWEIAVPGHPDEAEAILRAAAAGDGRVYLRLSEQRNAEPRPIEPGRMTVMRRRCGRRSGRRWSSLSSHTSPGPRAPS